MWKFPDFKVVSPRKQCKLELLGKGLDWWFSLTFFKVEIPWNGLDKCRRGFYDLFSDHGPASSQQMSPLKISPQPVHHFENPLPLIISWSTMIYEFLETQQLTFSDWKGIVCKEVIYESYARWLKERAMIVLSYLTSYLSELGDKWQLQCILSYLTLSFISSFRILFYLNYLSE